MPTISARTRLIALLGDPVAHSLSPRLQNTAFAAAGVDGIYLALRCDAESFAGLMTGIARAGGGGNVTLPHKALAASLLDSATAAVERTGACNTFWDEGGRLCGDNTDVAGFTAAARRLAGPLAGARVLLLGAGGAARAAAVALLDERVDAVVVFNRTTDRARELASALDAPGQLGVAEDLDTVRGERFDLVVNSTSLGLNPGDPLPLDFDRIGEAGRVLDLVYAPGETEWVREARRRGIPAADGREMLVAQGAAAFERWWGIPAPVDVMQRALEEAG